MKGWLPLHPGEKQWPGVRGSSRNRIKQKGLHLDPSPALQATFEDRFGGLLRAFFLEPHKFLSCFPKDMKTLLT